MSFARSFRLGILSLGALLFLAPYIFMLSTAAKSQQDIFSSSLSLIPHNWALWDNLAKAMSRVPMGLLLFNGVVVCALVLVFQVVVAIPCAYAMAKLKFRGQRAMMMMVMLGLLVPIHATALPFYVGFNQLGVLNSYFALSAPFFISVFGIFLFLQFFRAMPDGSHQCRAPRRHVGSRHCYASNRAQCLACHYRLFDFLGCRTLERSVLAADRRQRHGTRHAAAWPPLFPRCRSGR